jgi:hypothetical protein
MERRSGGHRVVKKITWQRAGGVTEPGRYMFTFGWLTVTTDDLAVWKQFPEASFTLVERLRHEGAGAGGDGTSSEEFHLGTFELPMTTSQDKSTKPEIEREPHEA